MVKNNLKHGGASVVATVMRLSRMSDRVLSSLQLRRRDCHCRTSLSVAIALLGAASWTLSEAAPLSLYEIKTQTDMPNLTENLRYADTQVRRCIDGNTVSEFFPILRYESLKDCTLEAGDRLGDTVYYPLVCNGSGGTTGAVLMYTHADSVEGLLEVKMGGKNMRFSQRIEATRQGDCQSLQ